ncbi:MULTISPECIES: hypothetical protein [Burkholderia]|uniref:Phage-related protein n=1 Tax=Burkholderia contaminans TaxID=488447 RepID=A0A2S5DRE7_9BURK|nr:MULTISPECIES: hypothetical protein [Burkholderia]EKS9798268.1 hypothetical protein [Burkholderia cepacia]EKS9805752.1 hypothetical protein [Burkholderia cepacia]EKS9813107.1 hypothetical protein [Burkholderia cepacia]EKS9822119.1 hypothetical protein [Burkholderia cepacia]EKS9827348.1 hypothetical protein [Burkholderia cepacia]
MKERPILFSGPMVRAILEGRKTQTRRVAIPKRSYVDFIGGGPKDGPDWNDPACWGFEDPNTGFWWALRGDEQCNQLPYPHGNPGDRLWVRETWKPRTSHSCSLDTCDCSDIWVDYQAAGDGVYFAEREIDEEWTMPDAAIKGRWVPSIHMPRWASRITLEITAVRAERLQSISWEDAIAEGIRDPRRAARRVDPVEGCVAQFRQLWDGLNAARGHGWDANPWVWVVEFRRIES